MVLKPTYEELEKRIQELEQSESDHKRVRQVLEERQDITRQKQTTKIRKKSERRYKEHLETIDSMGLGIFVVDRDYQIRHMNKTMIKWFGDQTGLNCHQSITGLDSPCSYCQLNAVIDSGKTINYDLTIPDGRSFDITCSPVHNSDGTISKMEIIRNITEQKKAEKLLQRNQALLKITQQLTKVGGWEWNVKKQTMFWTDEVYRIHDFNPNDFLSDSTRHIQRGIDCYDPKDRPIILKAFRNCVEKGQSYDLEFPFTTANGRRIWIRTIAKPIKENGEIIKVIGNIIDITDLKHKEEILQESKERFRQIYEYMAVGVARVSLEFRIESANNAYCSMIGYREDELIGKHLKEITHPEIIKENLLKQSQLVTGKIDHYRLEKKFIHKKGGIIHGILDASLVRSCSGKPLYFLGSVANITERKKAEEKLRSSEKKYRSILESMKDAAYICTPDFHIDYMNPRMISRVGHDALNGLCHKVIYNNDEKCSWCVCDQVQQGEHVEYELANPMDNRFYSVANSPIYHTDKSIYKLTIFRDITETKVIESQLRQSRKMESIGTMAGGIAHDFNNLLYMISGNTELALEDIPIWNPVYSNLEEIKSASLRAAGIVKQLLDFSRKTDETLKPMGVVTVIKEALKFLRSTIPATIEIHEHLPDMDIVILADPTQINQIMMNLCINASQSMEETGGELTVKIENVILDKNSAKLYPEMKTGNHVKVTIEDTGPGIDPESIDRIFDPYFTTKEIGKGSGLGLAVVLGIVKNHKGIITAESQPGNGALFTILFPVADDPPEIKSEIRETISPGDETILFVDDEVSISNMIKKMLERIGYTVKAVINPSDALEIFLSTPDIFDLVITDMTMPRMTGIKLAQKLKEIRSDIPVIICTGHSSLIDEEKAKRLGIDGYVMKPLSMATITKAIREVLDQR